MKIICLGSTSPYSTAGQRTQALSRLSHEVIELDPYIALKKQLTHKILGRIHFRTGYRFLQNKVLSWLKRELPPHPNFELIWINGGELFGSKAMQYLQTFNKKIVLYNNDDPTGGRDGRRFDMLLSSLKYYDLCVVMRELNVKEFEALGAKRAVRMFMSYDEKAHEPFEYPESIPEKFISDVAFIGTWMRDEARDEFMLTLIEQGIPISIWGNRWQKSARWKKIKPYYKGPGLKGRDYVAAIQGAKICIGMLSKGNRDLHTQRSMETPYAKGLLCAERTTEHQQLYKEGVEAVYWSDAKDCATVCKELLNDPQRISEIKQAGHNRIKSLNMGNEDVCKKIISTL